MASTSTLTMSHRELWEAIPISKARFYQLKALGVFDHLISPISYRYSREKVEAWIATRPVLRRVA